MVENLFIMHKKQVLRTAPPPCDLLLVLQKDILSYRSTEIVRGPSGSYKHEQDFFFGISTVTLKLSAVSTRALKPALT